MALASDKRLLDFLAAALRLVDMQPNNFVSHFKLGTAYYDLKMLDLAEISFKKALFFDPNHIIGNGILGSLYYF